MCLALFYIVRRYYFEMASHINSHNPKALDRGGFRIMWHVFFGMFFILEPYYWSSRDKRSVCENPGSIIRINKFLQRLKLRQRNPCASLQFTCLF